MVTIQLQAEPVEESETTILYRVRTGFGDPVLRVSKDQVQDVESLSAALEVERGRHDSITLPAAERGIKAEAVVPAARRLSHALAALGDGEGALPIPDGPELQELYDALGDLDGILARVP